MTINANDLKAYTKFIEARGRRTDMGAEFVGARIARLAALLADASSRKDAPAKVEMWRAELSNLEAVSRVMDASEKTGE